jgi:hypothetical protein
MNISMKIEKNTHRAILSLLYKKTNNSGYLVIAENFSQFIICNNFTYITGCQYFIKEFNTL